MPTDGADPRRSEPRLRTLLSGKLVFGTHDLTADCAVRNLSERGAKLHTTLAANLPRELWLIMVKKGCAYRATVCWRRGDEVGVRFESEHDLTRNTDPDLVAVRRVWREVAAR
ncbi:PilZ domain-containing protein [Phenylobacterium montanum]|uniref:PilZ domain-containing protein n=1 Tax=Phenylobacterium montanum TaxID=2823693 RepID=A0A975IUN0_9CAUL|nr:PilZ domain-containing protein [Caulobacter sp. S6]QUD86416.1 PilZ domain-containing protein [Caulobacter sp. S6]